MDAAVAVENTTNPNLVPHVHTRESIKPEYRATISVIVIVLIVFTTFGNLLTIIAVNLDKRLRSISNFYLASLAFADLLVGSIVMTFMLLYTVTFNGTWVFGPVFCDVWTFVDYVSCTASLTNVCLIAADRYQTVASPLRAIRRRTKRRAQYLIAAAWLVPVVFWIIVMLVLRLVNGRPPTGSCFLIWKPKVMAVVSASLIVYMPIVAILGFFVAMMCVLRDHMNNMTQRMRRSASYHCEKSVSYSQSQPSDDTTSLRSGGISFNPRFSVDVYSLGKKTERLQIHTAATAATDTTKTSDVQEFWVYSGTERKYRSVGTSTSPERYGLVRSIATSTSPVPTRRDTCVKHVQGTAEVTLCDADVPHFQNTDTDCPATDSASDVPSESETDTADGHVTTSSRSPSHESRLSCDSTRQRWRRYASLLRAERHSSMERSRVHQQMRAAKTLGIIMGFLLLCWLPFSIMWPLREFCPHCLSQRSYDISFWTNYLNSSINPIIYCLCNQNFRRAFKRLLLRHY